MLLAIVPPAPYSIDAQIRYRSLIHFVETGIPGRMQYSFLGPVLATPLWYLGRLAHAPQPWVMRYNVVLFGLMVAVIWTMLRARVDGALLRMFLLILVAESMFGVATQDFLGEMFTACLVGAGVLCAVTLSEGVGWMAVALGVANTPATVLALGLVALKRAFDRRRLRFLAIPVVALALILADSWFRGYPLATSQYFSAAERGAKTIMPYSGLPGFSYPLFLGVLAILLSFGKGLFFFAPGLLLPARRLLGTVHPPLATAFVLWLVFLAGLVLTYGRWWAWYGGFTWGPRFLLIASLPASLALAAWLRYPPRALIGLLAVFAVLLLSAWVAVNGLAWGNENLQACTANGFALEHLCWYAPEFSVLWRPFVAPKAVYTPVEIGLMAYSTVVVARLAVQLIEPTREALRPVLTRWRSWAEGWAV